jgi:hypothetical protein
VLGDSERAEQHFRAALVIDPGVALAAGTSPKITEPFEAARAYLQQRDPLRVEHQVRASPPGVSLSIASDPIGIVAGARAAFRAPAYERVVTADGAGALELVAAGAPDAAIQVDVAIVDEHGNIVRRLAPIGIDATAAPARASRPLYARWYLWGGLAAAAAGTGTYFGLAARGDRDELQRIDAEASQHDFREFLAVEDRMQRNSLIANISFGAAGALAVVSGILLVRELGDGDEPPDTASVTPVPLPDGAGVSVWVRF